MKLRSILIEIRLRVKQSSRAFFLLFLYWLVGIFYYIIKEPSSNYWEIFLISVGIRPSAAGTDFSALYQIIWPIFMEVIVFGFLISILLERYNPVITSKIISEHQVNHSIVLGYQHIGERIVEFLRENKKPYVLIDYNEDKVKDLIEDGEPVVVGDFTDKSVLLDAGVKTCKEIFFLTNDFRKAIICADQVRKLNKTCVLYMRVYEDDFQDYLEEEPWNAFTFSSSKWTMLGVKQWTENKTGPAIVLGRDHIAQLIAGYIANGQQRQVYLIDPEIDKEQFHETKGPIKIITDRITTLNKLDDYCDINQISQVFICWKSEKHFQESLLLTIDLHHNYKQIETFVRIFDEALEPIFSKYNAKTFSTSERALQMLQSGVITGSNIFDPNLAKTINHRKIYDADSHKFIKKDSTSAFE